VNGAVVVLGGVTTGSPTAVVQSLPASSAWASDPNIDIGRVGPGFVSTPGGLLVYGGGGGQGGTTALDYTLVYNVIGGDSQDAASLTTPRMQMAWAGDSGGNAYAIGGLSDTGANLATVEQTAPRLARG
jgi:hypothetical protein